MALKLRDLFTGTVDTDLQAHAPDYDAVGEGWIDNAANSIELDGSGGLKLSVANAASRIKIGTVDQLVEVNWNSGGADNRMGIQLRRDSATYSARSCYDFNFRQNDTTNRLIVNKVVAGTFTTIGSTANDPSFNSSTTYKLTAVTRGANQELFVNDVLYISTANADITTGSLIELVHYLRSSANGRFLDVNASEAAAEISTGKGLYTYTGYAPLVVQEFQQGELFIDRIISVGKGSEEYIGYAPSLLVERTLSTGKAEQLYIGTVPQIESVIVLWGDWSELTGTPGDWTELSATISGTWQTVAQGANLTWVKI